MTPRVGITDINSLRSRYAQAVERAGGEPVILSPGVDPRPADPLDGLDGLLLPGGLDVHPERYGQAVDPAAGVETDVDRDAYEFPILEAALARDLPMLAICRGVQVLNVALGGSLRQHLDRHRALNGGRGDSVYHNLTILPGTRLAGILDPTRVTWTNSRHHQGFGLAELAPDLEAGAVVPGEDLVEGVTSRRHTWVVGVQCHPERADEVPPEFANLFETFVAACRESKVQMESKVQTESKVQSPKSDDDPPCRQDSPILPVEGEQDRDFGLWTLDFRLT